MIKVNAFLAHLIKEIDVKRYGDYLKTLPITKTNEIYQYFYAMLKHRPIHARETFVNTPLYCRKRNEISN